MKKLNRIYRIAQVNKIRESWSGMSEKGGTRWQPTRLCRLIFVIDAGMQWDCAFGD
jgi:hypothetical protein